jgi:hypothetical protein
MNDLIRFMETADRSGEGFDEALEKKAQEYGDLVDAIFDWKHFVRRILSMGSRRRSVSRSAGPKAGYTPRELTSISS